MGRKMAFPILNSVSTTRCLFISSKNSCSHYYSETVAICLVTVMALQFDDVSAICPSKESWKIAVKVVRLWTTQSFNGGKFPFTLEMVLIDDKGSKIQASIRKTLIYKFDRLLSEGHVYCLTYFGVGDNGGSYRYTKHAFKLNFQFNTKVQELKDFPINILSYSFVPLSDIMFNEHDTDFLVDIIGILTGVGAEREYEKDRKKQKILTIELDADGVRVECAFFGSYVDEINSVLSSADMTNAVVLIQFAKVKIFKGKPSLQNVYGATKITFNPDIEEATKIREKFFEIYEHGSQVLSQLHDPEQLSVEEDFLKATVGKSIEQVKDLDKVPSNTYLQTVPGGTQLASATERFILTKICISVRVAIVIYSLCVQGMYRLQVRVIDDKDSASLVIFDHEATLLLGKSCVDLVEGNDEGTLPAEIISLFDKTFLFKIEVNNSPTSKFEPSFRVKRICTDNDVINQFKSTHSAHINGATPQTSLGTFEDLIEGVGSNVPKDLINEFEVVANEKALDNLSNVDVDFGVESPAITQTKRKSLADETDDQESGCVKMMISKIKKEK
ncbi:hypothetical protein OROGR_018402 [Orobanche gracilis]